MMLPVMCIDDHTLKEVFEVLTAAAEACQIIRSFTHKRPPLTIVHMSVFMFNQAALIEGEVCLLIVNATYQGELTKLIDRH